MIDLRMATKMVIDECGRYQVAPPEPEGKKESVLKPEHMGDLFLAARRYLVRTDCARRNLGARLAARAHSRPRRPPQVVFKKNADLRKPKELAQHITLQCYLAVQHPNWPMRVDLVKETEIDLELRKRWELKQYTEEALKEMGACRTRRSA